VQRSVIVLQPLPSQPSQFRWQLLYRDTRDSGWRDSRTPASSIPRIRNLPSAGVTSKPTFYVTPSPLKMRERTCPLFMTS
jgi:hypothetical protein